MKTLKTSGYMSFYNYIFTRYKTGTVFALKIVTNLTK